MKTHEQLAIDVKQKWESFPKITDNPISDFMPELRQIISDFGFDFLTPSQFEIKALNIYQEHLVDEWMDTYFDFESFIADKMLTVKKEPVSNYMYYLQLSTKES